MLVPLSGMPFPVLSIHQIKLNKSSQNFKLDSVSTSCGRVHMCACAHTRAHTPQPSLSQLPFFSALFLYSILITLYLHSVYQFIS